MSEHHFFLTRWFTKEGWIGKLFSKQPDGDVSIADATEKAADAIEQVLQYEDSIELITSNISDDVEQSTEEVVAVLENVESKLRTISTLPDLAGGLKDYRFSGDNEENDFIHDLVSMIALAFNDGKISIFEAAGIIARVISYIKLRKIKSL